MTSPLLKPFKIALILLATIAIIAAAVSFVAPQIRQRAEYSAELNLLLRGNAVREKEIAQLKKNRLDFQNSREFVEIVARKENRVRPNEVVFDFSTPAPRSPREQ
jgi:hypothetical protein